MIVHRQLIAAITKETRLIVRDWHALAVLFAPRSGADTREAIGGTLRDGAERGRELIEAKYSASVNVPLILRRMKDAVDASRRA